jgi:hypothetical protein
MTEEQALALYREHCQPGDRGALERHGEKAAVAAIMAACALNHKVTPAVEAALAWGRGK